MGQVKETVREATIGKVERVMDKVGKRLAKRRSRHARQWVVQELQSRKPEEQSADSMWRNPIPVALIGLGVGLLMMRRFRGNGGDGYERPRVTGGRRRNMMMDTDYEAGESDTGNDTEVKPALNAALNTAARRG